MRNVLKVGMPMIGCTAPHVTHIGGTVTAPGTSRKAAAGILPSLNYPGLYTLSTSGGMLSGWVKENGCGHFSASM